METPVDDGGAPSEIPGAGRSDVQPVITKSTVASTMATAGLCRRKGESGLLVPSILASTPCSCVCVRWIIRGSLLTMMRTESLLWLTPL